MSIDSTAEEEEEKRSEREEEEERSQAEKGGKCSRGGRDGSNRWQSSVDA